MKRNIMASLAAAVVFALAGCTHSQIIDAAEVLCLILEEFGQPETMYQERDRDTGAVSQTRLDYGDRWVVVYPSGEWDVFPKDEEARQ